MFDEPSERGFGPEVEQQAHIESCRVQDINELMGMCFDQGSRCFRFHDDSLLHQVVGTKVSDVDAVVEDIDRNLDFDT